jgi:mono/diheme cytochrome c family protein
MNWGSMRTKIAFLVYALALGSLIFAWVSLAHAEKPSGKKEATGTGSLAAASNYDADAMRVQGELRYRTNCGRCHAAPRKFPPRMMATVLRHMRVRATITDEDMRLVLFYMSQ